MWKTKKNNLICGYLEDYENQKKHIERVLSAKDMTKSVYFKFITFIIYLLNCQLKPKYFPNIKILYWQWSSFNIRFGQLLNL
jgi:hypothetical protein